jgi:hypothetical protein
MTCQPSQALVPAKIGLLAFVRNLFPAHGLRRKLCRLARWLLIVRPKGVRLPFVAEIWKYRRRYYELLSRQQEDIRCGKTVGL